MKLHHRRVQADGGVDLLGVGFDEQADADACVAERGHQGRERVELPGRVEAAFRGPLFPAFGYDAGCMRAVTECDGEHFRRRRHFQVQRHGQPRHQRFDVRVANVAAVFAQVGGDAVGTRGDGGERGAQGVRMFAAARVADGCDVVDVHAEPQLRHVLRSRLPGFVAGMAASSGGSASGA